MKLNYIPVPMDHISENALESVIRQHILSERSRAFHAGTSEPSQAEIDSVKKSVETGKSMILFDSASEETMIVETAKYLAFKEKQKTESPIWEGPPPGENNLV